MKSEIDLEILAAIAVCTELTGSSMTEAAIKIFAHDLSEHPKQSVLRALERCRRELRGRLTLADVLDRIAAEDGRPSADEAWAMCPMDESTSAIMNDEIVQALVVAQPLIDAGDKVAARMAFKGAYERRVTLNRANGIKLRWWPSLGHEVTGRDKVLEDLRALNDRARLAHEVPRLQSVTP